MADRVLFLYPPGPDRDLYVSALSGAGFDTTMAGTVASADTSIDVDEGFDVIVMELLPDQAEAWEFIERQRATHSDVPIIVLTALIRPDRANRRRARELGCAAFVAKPCSLAQLVDVVRQVRRGSRGLEIATYLGPHHGQHGS